MTPTKEERVTRGHAAYHEAGHAVVGTLLEIPIWLSTLRPSGEGNYGHTRKFGSSRDCEGWAHLVMSKAGREAARRVTRASDPDLAESDRAQEHALLMAWPPDQREGVDAAATAIAAAHVQLHWSWIERVARELIAKTQVVGSRVKELREE